MVDRDIVFNLKDKTVEIFSHADCLNKQVERRQMSQFTEEVNGHKPLSYESGSSVVQTVKNNSDMFLVIGVILVIVGVLGLFILLMKQG